MADIYYHYRKITVRGIITLRASRIVKVGIGINPSHFGLTYGKRFLIDSGRTIVIISVFNMRKYQAFTLYGVTFLGYQLIQFGWLDPYILFILIVRSSSRWITQAGKHACLVKNRIHPAVHPISSIIKKSKKRPIVRPVIISPGILRGREPIG